MNKPLSPAIATQTLYLDKERELAELLGWTHIVQVGQSLLGRPPCGGENSRGQGLIPSWCRDWAHCGPLIAQYGIDVQHDGKKTVCVNWDPKALGQVHDVAEHPTKDDALRYAVVRATIAKIKWDAHPQPVSHPGRNLSMY